LLDGLVRLRNYGLVLAAEALQLYRIPTKEEVATRGPRSTGWR
jgi:hypothetical protein